ncbi:hypothetical protein [Neobacillus vireti]|uniref:hypothetical protein n=1 Tax=Neobacillus vireti TaxID=220686 RepID=UPI002FFE1E0A
MKGKWALIIVLIIVFSGGRMAMADGDHSKVPATSSLNGQSEQNKMDNQDMESMDHNSGDGHEMEGMTGGDNMQGMDMEGSEGHSHEPVKEEPANLKVLGTYGAVNLSFIIIGVWNKWFRRKDGSDVHSKK